MKSKRKSDILKDGNLKDKRGLLWRNYFLNTVQ